MVLSALMKVVGKYNYNLSEEISIVSAISVTELWGISCRLHDFIGIDRVIGEVQSVGKRF